MIGFPQSKHYVLDANNNVVEVDMITWAIWLDQIGNRCVGYTEITSQCYVSTVFLGLDHRFNGKGPPIVFETMIFGGPLDHHMWRYASWDDADAGHKAAVRKTREAIGQKITT